MADSQMQFSPLYPLYRHSALLKREKLLQPHDQSSNVGAGQVENVVYTSTASKFKRPSGTNNITPCTFQRTCARSLLAEHVFFFDNAEFVAKLDRVVTERERQAVHTLVEGHTAFERHFHVGNCFLNVALQP